jgi:hypothetical protein
MATHMLVSEARDMFHQELADFRAKVMSELPEIYAECGEGCASKVTAELEKLVDDAIAKAEADFVESLLRQVDGEQQLQSSPDRLE